MEWSHLPNQVTFDSLWTWFYLTIDSNIRLKWPRYLLLSHLLKMFCPVFLRYAQMFWLFCFRFVLTTHVESDVKMKLFEALDTYCYVLFIKNWTIVAAVLRSFYGSFRSDFSILVINTINKTPLSVMLCLLQ